MSQLALFEGSHLPRTAAREALSRGALGEARAQLGCGDDATEEAADAARLERIASALRTASQDPVATLHQAFASALAEAEPRGFLSHAERFDLYARRVAHALAAQPGRRFRGWLGAHFAFVANETAAARRARRIVESLPPGPAWIDAARLAFELGEPTAARGWIHAACLDSPLELVASSPALERCGVPALDAAPPLPPLPAPVEDVFDAARAQARRLRGRAGWRSWGRSTACWLPRTRARQDPARSRSTAVTPRARFSTPCAKRGDRELRGRRRMQRIAPALLARYVASLRGALL